MGDAREIGSDAIALTERVARGALGLEQVTPGRESRNRPSRFVALCDHRLPVLPSNQKIGDGGGKEARVVDR